MDKEETAKAVVDEAPQTPTEEFSEPMETERLETDGEAARKKKRKVVVAAVAALVVLLLVGAGAAQAMSDASGRPADKQAVVVDEKKDKEVGSEVKFTLKADGADAAAALAKVKVTSDGKDVVSEREVACNKAVKLGKLEKGDYELVVTSTPVLEDGSTYKLPETAIKVSVDGKGKAIEIEYSLSKVAKEEMSKEQLEAAASALETAGKTDVAASVAESAKSAPSVPGSENSVKQDAAAPSTPSGGSGSGSNTGGGSGSGGGQTGPSEPQHVHNFSTPIYGNGAPIYGNGAPIYGNGAPIIKETYHCVLHGIISGGEYSSDMHNGVLCLEACWIDETITGYEQVITGYEQIVTGYEQVVTGYQCSCGATK